SGKITRTTDRGRSLSNFSRWRLQERNARTDFTDVDCCNLPAEAESGWPQEISVRVDAGAAFQVQPGVRGLRKDSIPGTYFEAGTIAGRVLQGGRRVRDADGVDTGRRAADAFADRQNCGRAGCAKKI